MSEKKIVKQKVQTVFNPVLQYNRDFQITYYDDGSFSVLPYFKLIPLPKDLFPMKSKPKLPAYELFQLKNGTWKWRKRAKNRAILNHQYNTKAAAIKGMKADYAVTVAMESFEYREVKK